MTPFANGLTIWLLMCANEFAPKSSKARSRLASIQLDESTDSSLESHLIVFTQYEKDKKMKEEFLCLAIHCQPQQLLCFKANELSWQNFKHICTDGAPAMIGVKLGFVTLVKNEWPHMTSSHCLLHQYTLAS